MTAALALPLAAALLAGDWPLAERRARLKPYLDPPPGGELTLDSRELRDLKRTVQPTHFRGHITVSPPTGQCFTLRRPDLDDEVVCKKTQLTYTLNDLDRGGALRWSVVTGDGDFGTEIVWHSPYRLAIVTTFDKAIDDQPEYRFLGACTATKSESAGRRVQIRLLTGELWTIRFPDVDELVPQPDADTNLYVAQSGGKMSVKDAEANKSEETKAGDEKKAEEADPTRVKPKPVAKPQQDDRKVWAIPARGAFHMGADHFQPFGPVPKGMKGECRYLFEGPAEDPGTGRLECHDVDGFKQVLLPLTCMAQLKL